MYDFVYCILVCCNVAARARTVAQHQITGATVCMSGMQWCRRISGGRAIFSSPMVWIHMYVTCNVQQT